MPEIEKSKIPSLETRHAFLDTQVFKQLKHNADNPALRSLANFVASHRIVVHSTEITGCEIYRQLREAVAERLRDLSSINRDLNRWRHAAPDDIPPPQSDIDADALSASLFAKMATFIAYNLKSINHLAMDVATSRVFDNYFDRKPPFDRENSKEFPDGFVLMCLDDWCEKHGHRLYVVTADAAMLRGAAASRHLIPLGSLNTLLTMASVDLDADVYTVAEAVLNHPNFDFQLETHLADNIGYAEFVYFGDLPEGEAYGGTLVRILEVSNWDVIGIAGARVCLKVDVDVTALVEIKFEDRTHARYDREEDRWVGGETANTEIETEVTISSFIEIEIPDAKFTEFFILDQEVPVHERYEDFR